LTALLTPELLAEYQSELAACVADSEELTKGQCRIIPIRPRFIASFTLLIASGSSKTVRRMPGAEQARP